MRLIMSLGFVLIATTAQASSLTVENLFEDFTATSVSFWANDLRIVSASLVTTPELPENYVLAPIDAAHPLVGGQSRTWTLPTTLDNGFTFGELMIGGTLPHDSGFAIWPDGFFNGDPIGLGISVFTFLWPATDGGTVPIFRAIYTSGPEIGSASQPHEETPEPSSLALLTVGAAVLLWRRHFGTPKCSV